MAHISTFWMQSDQFEYRSVLAQYYNKYNSFIFIIMYV